MALRELLAHFDIETAGAETALKAVDSKIDKASSALGGLAEAFIGGSLIHGITEFIGHQIELGSRVNDLSEKLGIGTDELQSFQFAAGLAGVGSESAAKALQFLNKNMGEAIGGNKEAAETFAKLGIAIKDENGVRELGDVIPEVADAFAGLGSDQERTAMAMKLFGKSGADLLPLLKKGGKELGDLRKEFDELGGGMSKEFTEKADEAGDEIDKLKFGFGSLKSKIAIAVLPIVTSLAKKFQGWIKFFLKIERQTHLAKAALVLFGSAGALAGAKVAGGFAKMLGVLPKDASFWKTLLGLGEIGLVIAAVIVLALIFEDLFRLINGEDSLIGELMTEFFGAEKAAEFTNQLKGAWTAVSGAIKELGPPLKQVGELLLGLAVQVAPMLLSAFVIIVKWVATLVTLLTAVASSVAQIIGAVAKRDFTGLGDSLGKTVDRAGNAIFGVGGLTGNKGTTLEELGVGAYAQSTAVDTPNKPAMIGPPPPVNANVNVTNNIDGAKSPSAVAAEANQGVSDALGAALANGWGAQLQGG